MRCPNFLELCQPSADEIFFLERLGSDRLLIRWQTESGFTLTKSRRLKSPEFLQPCPCSYHWLTGSRKTPLIHKVAFRIQSYQDVPMNEFDTHKRRRIWAHAFLEVFLESTCSCVTSLEIKEVEARGVEPLSEQPSSAASPCSVSSLVSAGGGLRRPTLYPASC